MKVNNVFKNSSKLAKVLMLLIPMLAIYCLPIILSDRFYIDDLGRTLYGYSGWGPNGRPLSDILMKSLSFGEPLLDISPLNQLASIFLLASVLFLYMRRNFKESSFVFISASIFLFIANPFFIENLSYKYDSLPMSLSMITLILPFCFKNEGLFKQIISVTLVICSLCFYQASLGLFAILSVIEVVICEDKNQNKNVIKSISSRILQIFSGFSLYQIVIAPRFVEGEYNITHSKTLPLSTESVDKIKSNFESIFWYFDSYFSSIPKYAVIIYTTIFTISILILLKESLSRRKFGGVLYSFTVLLSPILVLLFSFAPMLMLEHPVFAPRVLICFGGVMMFYSIIALKIIKPIYLQAVVCIPITWVCLFYSYSYSASTTSQNKMDDLISTSISMDVNHYGKTFKYVNVLGKMPESTQFKLAQSKLPILSRLIPIYLNGDWLWGAELLNHYGLNLQYKVTQDNRGLLLCEKEPFIKTNIYSLYDFGDLLIISFEDRKC